MLKSPWTINKSYSYHFPTEIQVGSRIQLDGAWSFQAQLDALRACNREEPKKKPPGTREISATYGMFIACYSIFHWKKSMKIWTTNVDLSWGIMENTDEFWRF